MLPRVVGFTITGPHSLMLRFSNGRRKRVNILALLTGPVLRPLRSPAYFRKAMLDTVAGTLVWPNGADIAPETLYQLPSESGAAPRSNGSSPARPARPPRSGSRAPRKRSPRRAR